MAACCSGVRGSAYTHGAKYAKPATMTRIVRRAAVGIHAGPAAGAGRVWGGGAGLRVVSDAHHFGESCTEMCARRRRHMRTKQAVHGDCRKDLQGARGEGVRDVVSGAC